VEFIALQNYKRATGYLKHIFQLNSMEYWDNLKLNEKLKRVFNKISIKKFFQMEIWRYKRGVDRTWAWIDELRYNRALFSILDISKDDIPSLNEYSIMLRNLGSDNVFNYFFKPGKRV